MNLWDFKAAVQKGSDWDYKYDEESIFGYAWEARKEYKTTFSFGDYSDMTAADVGNYHFGYMGKFANGRKGFPNYILWKAAGFAETRKEWNEGSKFKAIIRAGDLINPLNMTSGDRIKDFIWSTKGLIDANRIKRR